MKHFTDVRDIGLSTDLWKTLCESRRKLVMYGTGNGADKICEVLKGHNKEVDEFVVSDDHVRGQTFHNKTVRSFQQIFEQYVEFDLVVAFGSRLPDVTEKILELEKRDGIELFIPDVPVVADDLTHEIFDLEYFEAHRKELQEVCDSLYDERSRAVLCDMICYRLTGKPEYLFSTVSTRDEVYSILGAADFVNAIDLGAYNGDTIRELSEYSERLEKVTAFEPDERNFRKLRDYPWGEKFTVEAINAAAWDEDGEITFVSGGNRNSSASSSVGLSTGAKLKRVRSLRPDSAVENRPVDYIKYDVEGAEERAIAGSTGIISSSHPALSIAAYHRTADLFRLPALVEGLGYEKLWLRRYACIPGWELNLLVK